MRGEGVSPGYWRRDELTAERFGPNELRTGDLGRRLPDGRIIHTGRRDEQLNVRGYRVEPAEIEAVLAAVDGVRECALGQVERGGEDWLVAWVTAEHDAVLDDEQLRGALAARLPDYMQPQIFERVEALPRLPNGKLDRQALPEPGTRRERDTQAVPARHELEAELQEIWQDVLISLHWVDTLCWRRVSSHVSGTGYNSTCRCCICSNIRPSPLLRTPYGFRSRGRLTSSNPTHAFADLTGLPGAAGFTVECAACKTEGRSSV